MPDVRDVQERDSRHFAPWLAYVFASVATLATLAGRILLDGAFRGYPGLLFFMLPILASAHFGGLRGGLMATFLSCLASQYLLWLPLRPSVIDSDVHRSLQLFLAVAGVVVSALNEARYRAQARSWASVRKRNGEFAEQDELARRLEHEKARLVAAQSVAKVGSWETDLATGNVSWSDETHRIFGTRPGEFAPTRASFLERVHPDDRARVDEAFVRSLGAKADSALEHRVLAADGSIKAVEERWQTSFGADGRAVRVLGTCQDITERRVAEDAIARATQAIEQQKTELQVLFDLMPAMIWFKDTQDGIVRVNRRAAEALGRPVEEIEGRPTAEVYPRDAARYREADREVIDSGVAKLGIVETLVDAAGGESWIQTDKVPYFDAAGNVVGIVVMAQDITERRRSEAELRQTNLELVEASRLAGMAEVATDVLHNVGNVLNSVNVSATLVVDHLRVSRASRMAAVVKLLRDHHHDLGHYLTADSAGQHVPELLEELSRDWVAQEQLLSTELGDLRANVDLIKRIVAAQQGHAVAAAGAPESPEAVAPDQLIEEAVLVQQDRLTRQKVRIVREFEHLAPICVAKHKVVQILASLLRNARQACVASTEIDRCITVRIERLGSRARISVRDNGTGIAPENLVRIFTPTVSGRRNFGGYGLHACALAAHEMGGKLSAASDGPGRGATFTLELPIEPAMAPA